MENIDYLQYGLYFGAMLMGIIAHMVKKLANLNKQGTLITPVNYFKLYPYQTTLVFLGGLAGYFLMISTGDISFISALLAGFTADSIFERKIVS